MFRMASLNSVTVDGDAEKEVPVFGRINFLQPQDSRQYLFSLTPRNDLRTNYKQLRGATNIGRKNSAMRNVLTRKVLTRKVLSRKVLTRKVLY